MSKEEADTAMHLFAEAVQLVSVESSPQVAGQVAS